MEKESFEPFVGKQVRILLRSTSRDDPYRTFKLTGIIKQVNSDSIVFFTDHTGVIALSEIVGIEELGDAH